MYYVTYRNVLQPGKTIQDYRDGLKRVWPKLQEWGAENAEMFQPLYDESGAFFTRYSVGSLDTWNEHLMSKEFMRMLSHLSDILDLQASKVDVTVSIPTGL